MDEKFFEICIKEAKISYQHGDVPIGAVIVKNNKIIAKAHNTREKKHDITGHAEINVIKKAAKKLGRWNLSDCLLYVTLAPCSMCKEVIKQSRIRKTFFILDKPGYKKEFSNSEYLKSNYQSEQMYAAILSAFFKEKR